LKETNFAKADAMSKRSFHRSFIEFPALLTLLMATVLPFPATALARWSAPAGSPPQPAAQAAQATPATPGDLHLLVGHSLVITSPVRLTRVSVADPDIADAIVVVPNQLLINGKKAGAVSLVLWDENGQTQSFDLYVDLDVSTIANKVRESFPDEPVSIEASRDLVTLSGRVSSEDTAKRIMEIVQAVAPKVVSLLQVPPPPPSPEILLEVTFAEVDRTALSQFGINYIAPGTQPSGPGSTVGTLGTQQFSPPRLNSLTVTPNSGGPPLVSADFTLSDLLNLFVFRHDIDLAVLIKALAEQNVLQILASPNLLTQAGKEASFLAGGEFPFPVLQSGSTTNAVTITFKEFGVRLTFLPTISPDGRIHLRVTPEVSALDFANALTVSGFLIPALSTRRVQTEMDLDDGQSFAIAGLVDDRLTRITAKFPGLGDIPVLGQLFRSHSFSKSKTELLVMVTPRIVRPDQTPPPGPQFPFPFLPPAAPEGTAPPSSGR
jgi:pilus assembly protein CpaC